MPPTEADVQNGNFVVKISKMKFNHVSPNQTSEWLNAVGKSGGGLLESLEA